MSLAPLLGPAACFIASVPIAIVYNFSVDRFIAGSTVGASSNPDHAVGPALRGRDLPRGVAASLLVTQSSSFSM